jgi:hypothetical protein
MRYLVLGLIFFEIFGRFLGAAAHCLPRGKRSHRLQDRSVTHGRAFLAGRVDLRAGP